MLLRAPDAARVRNWPDGSQAQASLEQNVEEHDLAGVPHLGTEVVRWPASTQMKRAVCSSCVALTGASVQDGCNHLVVANGIFSEPHVPDLAGARPSGPPVVASSPLVPCTMPSKLGA